MNAVKDPKEKSSFIISHQSLLAFICCSIVSIGIGVALNHILLYDASNYYTLGQSFVHDGSFSFANYMVSLRGYFFPLLIMLVSRAGEILQLSPSQSMSVISSLFAAAIFTVVIPNLLIKKNTGKTLILRFLMFAVFMLFWSDLVFYPLSDLWGFGFAVLSAALINQLLSKKHSLAHMILYSVLLGLSFYATYNIRTAYLFVVPIQLVIYIVFHIKQKKNIYVLLVSLALIVVGMIALAAPQMAINSAQSQSLSPLVNTAVTQEQSLYAGQIQSGLAISRYETLAPMKEEGLKGALYFIDDAGEQLSAQFKTAYLNGKLSMMKFILVNFFDLAGIYMRHFINILCMPFHQVYISDLYFLNNIYMLLSYTLTFSAGAYLVRAMFENKKQTSPAARMRTWLFVSWVLVSFATLPGIVEMRFFMPMYVIIYGVFLFRCLDREFLTNIWTNKWKYLLAYVFVFLMMLAVWTNTLANGDPIDLFMRW
ncbi:MAG: hypothetical protein AB1Z19_02180 [Eubacteriales bacterium]